MPTRGTGAGAVGENEKKNESFFQKNYHQPKPKADKSINLNQNKYISSVDFLQLNVPLMQRFFRHFSSTCKKSNKQVKNL